MSAELFYPQAKLDPAPDDGGPMQPMPMRGVLHTTEGTRFADHRSAIEKNNTWPHFSCIFENGSFKIFQHIPINRAARTLEHRPGTPHTNQANAIQIEIVGICDPPKMTGSPLDVPNWPRGYLEGIAAWMRWVEGHGVKREATVTFKAPPATGVRLSEEAWSTYNGWLGHQHVPNNAHVDPGAIDIATLLGMQEEDFDMATGDEILAELKSLRKDLTVFGTHGLEQTVENFAKNQRDALKRLADLERQMGDLATKVEQAVAQRTHP